MTDDDFLERAWRWRGVEDPCLTCNGVGMIMYGISSTWRGGAGATSMAWDTCSSCWGTGDRFRHGVNLRQLRDEESKRIAEGSIRALADSTGAQFRGKDTLDLMLELDRIVDRRKLPPSVFVTSMVLSIRNLVARAIGAQERRL